MSRVLFNSPFLRHNAFPRRTGPDVVKAGFADIELFKNGDQFSRSHPSSIEFSDLQDIVPCKFGIWIIRAFGIFWILREVSVVPIPLDTVQNVSEFIASILVVRITARWIVARMECLQKLQTISCFQKERYSIGPEVLPPNTGNRESDVSIPVRECGGPWPTFIWPSFINVGPKACKVLIRQVGDWCKLSSSHCDLLYRSHGQAHFSADNAVVSRSYII